LEKSNKEINIPMIISIFRNQSTSASHKNIYTKQNRRKKYIKTPNNMISSPKLNPQQNPFQASAPLPIFAEAYLALKVETAGISALNLFLILVKNKTFIRKRGEVDI
jgi:hypothetical protein